MASYVDMGPSRHGSAAAMALQAVVVLVLLLPGIPLRFVSGEGERVRSEVTVANGRHPVPYACGGICRAVLFHSRGRLAAVALCVLRIAFARAHVTDE